MLHGNKIWISELFSLIFVYTTLFLLFSLSIRILLNEYQIYHNSRKCAALMAEKAETERILGRLSIQHKIAAAIKSVVGGSVSPKVFSQLIDHVYNNSKTYGYDPLLVLAVIEVESVFEPLAKGRYKDQRLSGALGLMQVKPETAREVAKDLGMPIPTEADLFKPEVNIVVGIAYLTKCIGTFKSFKLGLLAYNQGPGVIMEHLQERQPLSVEYYKRVLKKYYHLQKSVEGL